MLLCVFMMMLGVLESNVVLPLPMYECRLFLVNLRCGSSVIPQKPATLERLEA